MKSDSGVALILALLVLSFLTIIGTALLSTTAIDIWIGDNYKSATQNLYVAEAGIEQGREVLRSSPSTPTQLLTQAAGTDGVLVTSTDLAALLASDDQPLIPTNPLLRSNGEPLKDSSGNVIGRYYVWLRNDSVDGVTHLADSNGVLTLLAIGQIGSNRKVVEALVQKGRFPDLPGTDIFTDPRLTTVAGLESLVASITKNADDVYNPLAGVQAITNYGSIAGYRIAVVNGDAALGPGSGFGLLLVRGAVRVMGNFNWNGLILVIGQGVLTWTPGTSGIVHGGLFIAPTLAPGGTLLPSPGSVTANLSPATIFYDAAAIEAANRPFPYNAIAIVER